MLPRHRRPSRLLRRGLRDGDCIVDPRQLDVGDDPPRGGGAERAAQSASWITCRTAFSSPPRWARWECLGSAVSSTAHCAHRRQRWKSPREVVRAISASCVVSFWYSSSGSTFSMASSKYRSISDGVVVCDPLATTWTVPPRRSGAGNDRGRRALFGVRPPRYCVAGVGAGRRGDDRQGVGAGGRPVGPRDDGSMHRAHLGRTDRPGRQWLCERGVLRLGDGVGVRGEGRARGRRHLDRGAAEYRRLPHPDRGAPADGPR